GGQAADAGGQRRGRQGPLHAGPAQRLSGLFQGKVQVPGEAQGRVPLPLQPVPPPSVGGGFRGWVGATHGVPSFSVLAPQRIEAGRRSRQEISHPRRRKYSRVRQRLLFPFVCVAATISLSGMELGPRGGRNTTSVRERFALERAVLSAKEQTP